MGIGNGGLSSRLPTPADHSQQRPTKQAEARDCQGRVEPELFREEPNERIRVPGQITHTSYAHWHANKLLVRLIREGLPKDG